MSSIGFEASELRTLERRLQLGERDARVKASDAVRKAAFEIERRAKMRAAVDTGNMRNSINTTIEGDVYSALSAEVGPEAHYGVFVELGTERMAPQPFLGPAFDEVEPSFIQALQKIDPLGGGRAGA